MTHEEQTLWGKLKNFEFDKPGIQLSFAKRLARENHFSNEFTVRIIEEYKKFIFLCCVSKNQITPSHHVDLAWHLHLTYTKSYWIDLCKNTIQKELHHLPTEGGVKENNKFRNFYNDTLALYEYYFQTKAPADIWQNDHERFNNRISNIDLNKNWIIPKPTSTFLHKLKLPSLAFIISIMIIGCNYNDKESSAWIFFVLLSSGILMLYFAFRNSNKRRKTKKGDSGCSGGDGYGCSATSCSSGHDSHGSHGGDSGCSSGCGSGCGGGCGGGD